MLEGKRMGDHRDAVSNFSAAELEQSLLAGSLEKGLNACIECCDRWANDDRIALEWFGLDGAHKTFSFAALRQDAVRFANYLVAQGVRPGDVVAGFLSRIPELFVVAFG